MATKHRKSFFGQEAGLILSTSSLHDDFIFVRLIKRKPNGSWEKPSKNEGRSIKLSLEEIVRILDVLSGESSNWTTYHSYADKKTQICFKWSEKEAKTLWVNVGDCAKTLNGAETKILTLLLEHLLKEKIANATIPPMERNASWDEKKPFRSKESSGTDAYKSKEISLGSDAVDSWRKGNYSSKRRTFGNENADNAKTEVNGSIVAETAKALLINFSQGGKEKWIPKSTIHNSFQSIKENAQVFVIDNWILEKNQIPVN